MSTDDRNVVERLALAEITLSASLDVPGGSETVALDVDQALAYMADPKAFSACYFGISVDDYEEWVASEGLARCVAPTKVGERCRNPVRGASQLSARARSVGIESGDSDLARIVIQAVGWLGGQLAWCEPILLILENVLSRR